MIDYHDYIGEKIKIKDKDGNMIEGLLISYEVGEMEDRDYDSIGLEQEGKAYIIDIPIPDIKEFGGAIMKNDKIWLDEDYVPAGEVGELTEEEKKIIEECLNKDK